MRPASPYDTCTLSWHQRQGPWVAHHQSKLSRSPTFARDSNRRQPRDGFPAHIASPVMTSLVHLLPGGVVILSAASQPSQPSPSHPPRHPSHLHYPPFHDTKFNLLPLWICNWSTILQCFIMTTSAFDHRSPFRNLIEFCYICMCSRLHRSRLNEGRVPPTSEWLGQMGGGGRGATREGEDDWKGRGSGTWGGEKATDRNYPNMHRLLKLAEIG